jgi:hypothetical protein
MSARRYPVVLHSIVDELAYLAKLFGDRGSWSAHSDHERRLS